MLNNKYGKLTVVKLLYKKKRNYYECICDCGNIVIKREDRLIEQGENAFCGHCVHINTAKWRKDLKELYGLEIVFPSNTKHPLSHTVKNIYSRCFNPDDPFYHNYGGRGITVEVTK
ncbi:hypothetical protein [Anoxybacillus flavithermus]|uniref:hypothetical protein n=1 Tax=Anoxybacillus flavithermus TaxID=33934 RepID=UPI0007D9FD98|nr:hypothetical protein [Anoxybacillus flavithermus]